MKESYRYWNHGVNLIPEYTKEYTKTDNGLYLRRAGWGTVVRQKANTSNWFHIPLTSASSLDGDYATINAAFLKVKVNNFAVITDVHVTSIDQSPYTNEVYPFYKKTNYTGIDDVLMFKFKETLNGGALAISVHVKFETDKGEVIFRAAGANLFEN